MTDKDKALEKLRLDNLKMRIHIEIILDGGKPAEKILAYYRKLREQKREQELENLN